MKHLLIVLVSVMLVAVPLSTASAAAPTQEEQTVADFVLVGPMVHPYINVLQQGAEQAAKDLEVEMYYLSPVAFDATRQLEMIEAVIHWPGIKGIAVHPGDPHAFDTVYEELQDMGIKLVVAGGGCTDTSPYPVCFSTDFYQAGWDAAAHMAELMDHTGQVAVALGHPNDINVVLRGTGMEDYIKENEPDMEVAVVVKDMDTPEGTITGAESILSAYPDVKGILGTCQFCGVGPAAAIEAAGRTDVFVSGFDDSPEMIEAIQKGNASFTVMQQPWGQGYLAMWVLDQLLQGKEPAMRYVDTGTTFVDASNADSYMEAVKDSFWDNLFPYFEAEVMLEPEAAAAAKAAAEEAATSEETTE